MNFSIIVPMHNSSASISRCIDSIQKQTEKKFECFLIDDGSTDQTVDICKSKIKNDSRFKIIKQRNKGVSAARNKGLENASGDYIVFIDSDDRATQNLLQEIEKNASDEIIQYGFYACSDGKKLERINSGGKFDIMAGNMAVVWRHALPAKKTSALRFDETLSGGEDYLFLNEALKKVKKVKTLRTCLYEHNFDQKNSIMNNIDLDLLKQQVEATKKAKALYAEEELIENKKAFIRRENWCKGELILYTFNLFDKNASKVKIFWRKLLKKVALTMLK